MTPDTIIGVPFEPLPPLRSLLRDAWQNESQPPGPLTQRLFKIRSADSAGQRSSASILINRMYATRGYNSSALPERQLPVRITLLATEHEQTIGTITIGFDSPAGLHLDACFGAETAPLRLAGQRLCEFTKLAVDNVTRSKRVLASLFHVAYMYAFRLMAFDLLLIEVNPRHVRFYQGMLGFKMLGAPRHNHTVNAPAVLLCLDFAYMQEQLGRFAGRPELSLQARSLYPYFFSIEEEASIVGRLMRTQPDASYCVPASARASMAQKTWSAHAENMRYLCPFR